MIRKTVFAGLIVLAFFSLYLGALSPYVRAREYIAAIRALSSIHTIQEFEEQFNRSLLFPSPIGKEEIVKFLSNDILSIISQQNQPEGAMRELVRFIEPHLFRNNVRHLLAGGQMHFVLWGNYGKHDEDLGQAESYFREALAIGPNLPPVLYALRGLYQASGDEEKLQEINSMILRSWPPTF